MPSIDTVKARDSYSSTLLVKIGFTERDVDDRLREFQTGCPGILTPLLQMSGTRQDEQAWHERFAAARERGEWFRPVPELLQAVDQFETWSQICIESFLSSG